MDSIAHSGRPLRLSDGDSLTGANKKRTPLNQRRPLGLFENLVPVLCLVAAGVARLASGHLRLQAGKQSTLGGRFAANGLGAAHGLGAANRCGRRAAHGCRRRAANWGRRRAIDRGRGGAANGFRSGAAHRGRFAANGLGGAATALLEHLEQASVGLRGHRDACHTQNHERQARTNHHQLSETIGRDEPTSGWVDCAEFTACVVRVKQAIYASR